jgi:hypothetical protein
MGVIVIVVDLDNENDCEIENKYLNEYYINIYEEMTKIVNNINVKYDKFRENSVNLNNNEIYYNTQYISSKPIPIPKSN